MLRSLSTSLLLSVVVFVSFENVGWSQPNSRSKSKTVEATPDPEAAPAYYANRSLQMRFGLSFEANDNYCSNLLATIPFPSDWPEQKVTIVANEVSPVATFEPRKLPGGTTQLVFRAAAVQPQDQFQAILTIQVEKSFIRAPSDPTKLAFAKPIPKEAQMGLGPSPYIEPDYNVVKKIAKEIRESEPPNAWAHVERIYDWVRDNIEYRNGDIRSTTQALKDKYGDCEEMTGIFIAICRASNIPARCVWIPEHCYPEFYLQDTSGNGYWFPCQVAGDRQFGEMKEYRPILQKGDRFKVPEKSGLQRYVSEYFTCKQRKVGPTPPKVRLIRELGGLEQEIEALQSSRTPEFSSDDADR